MSTQITCPNCNHVFAPTEAYEEEVKKRVNEQAKQWQQKKEEEFKNKELQIELELQKNKQLLMQKDAEAAQLLATQKQQLQQQLEATLQIEKKQLQEQIQEQLRKQITADFETQLQFTKQQAEENAERLKQAQAKELELLKSQQQFQQKLQNAELDLQRKLVEERERIKEQISKDETEKQKLREQDFELKMREKDKQMEDQKKLIEEMKRKAEQGSMQLQGEVQELYLEEILQKTFPFDVITEVGKGVRGADCTQTVRTKLGQDAGTIMYESKRTKDFSNEWIEKLKANMRSKAADIAVIVTQTLPKDMDRFGEKDGIYICTFTEVRSVALLLRNALLKIYEVKRSQENKGDKMSLLYDYLIGNEFSEQWKAISEGFKSMKESIQTEKNAMEKLWKAREKQLEKVLLNAVHIKGSIEGIAGADINLNFLNDNDTLLID